MAGDREEHWWSLRKGTVNAHLEWGHTYGTLFVTELRMRKGPPVTIALSLEHNFRTRSKDVGTYLDATALADGGLRELRLVQISDNHALSGLRFHLQHTEDRSTPWRLLVQLRGEHSFSVQPEYRTIGAAEDLLLRVVGGPA